MNPKNRHLDGLPDVPWITEDGYFDPAKFPIDGVLKQALSGDPEEFRGACSVLETMYCHGKEGAGIYLLGLLHHYRDDLERLKVIARGLRRYHTPGCAAALFSEIRRVKSSNKTRSYLNTVIDALSSFPSEMVREGFEGLSEDSAFTYRMRRKFRDILYRIEVPWEY